MARKNKRNRGRAPQQNQPPAIPPSPAPAISTAYLVSGFIGASGTALYLTLVGFGYSAALAGDMLFATGALFLAWLVAVVALWLSELFGAFAEKKKLLINIMSAIAIALVTGAIWAYFDLHQPDPLAGKTSQYAFAGIRPVAEVANPNVFPVHNGKAEFNVWVTNKGALPVYPQRIIVESYFSATAWTPDDIKAKADYLAQQARITVPELENTLNAMNPGDSGYMTPTDVTVTTDQIKDVLSQRGVLYVFLVALSRDQALHGKGYRLTKVCIAFFGTFSHWEMVANSFDTIP